MAEFRCPRCQGNNYFLGTRLRSDGYGGAYEGKSAICRKCDEPMDILLSDREDRIESIKMYGGAALGVVVLVMAFFIFSEL
jgi:hypothetical protein